MDKKDRIYLWISMILILFTGGFNLYGYFNLPAEIATQFSFSGDQVNHMPTPIYLTVSFGIVFILSMFSITKGQDQKLKYTLVNLLITVANLALIISQL